jgi:hypothetical protein
MEKDQRQVIVLARRELLIFQVEPIDIEKTV